MQLFESILTTPLSDFLTIASHDKIYMMEFMHRSDLHTAKLRLEKFHNAIITSHKTDVMHQLEHELQLYFDKKLLSFTVPIELTGSPFQKLVWNALLAISHGETCAYQEIAHRIQKPKAYRAVANAIGQNHLPIIVPCHRIINKNGKLGGFSGGIEIKIKLLEHEK